VKRRIKPLRERFWRHVEPEPKSGCWLWTAGVDGKGYGQIRGDHQVDGSTKYLRAHRVAYEMAKGSIPKGLVLDHLCRNKTCVNPDHLEPVPQKTNVMRGSGFNPNYARLRERTHCVHGHPFTPENTYWPKHKRKRVCKTCRRLSQQRSK
jgi:HNH endonuclease